MNIFSENFNFSSFDEPLMKTPSFLFNFEDASPNNGSKHTNYSSEEDHFSQNDFSTSESDCHNKVYIGKSFNQTPYEDLIDLVYNETTDLNTLVHDVLSSGPKDPQVKRKRVVKAKSAKRTRKSSSQVKALVEAYKMNENWEKEDVLEISSKTGLKDSQVYKWYWDQQKKQGITRGK